MTQATYRLDIYNTSGALQYVLDLKEAPYTLGYTRRVNAPGALTFTLPGDSDILSNIADKWQVEVWRRPDGGSWGRELSAFYRDLDPWEYTDQSIATMKCQGIMSMLSWVHVAYYAKTANRSYFTSQPVETIANTLVKYNATTAGTTGDGRVNAIPNAYPFSGLSVEADGGDGTSIEYYCAYDNLLETLQNLVVGEGDFDIVKTSSTAWQWRYYHGQLGADYSSTIVFALERGNMRDPTFKDIRSAEKTVAIVAGQGEESDRDVVVRTGTNYATTNYIETFVNATDIDLDDTTALQNRGDNALSELEAVKSFSFGVLDTENTQYGVDYDLGNLVTAINPYDGTSYTVKVNEVAISLDSDGNENLEIGVVEPV
jgi:hypothetical protein